MLYWLVLLLLHSKGSSVLCGLVWSLHSDSQAGSGSWAGTLWQPDRARVMGWYTLTARQSQGHGLDCTLTAKHCQGHGLVHSDSQTGPGSWAGTLWQPDGARVMGWTALWQPDGARVMGWYTLTARQVQGHGLVHSDSQIGPGSWAGLHSDSQTEPGSWAGTLWQPNRARVMGWYTLTARQSQGHGLVHSDSQTEPGSWAGTLWQPDRARVMGWYTLTARRSQGHGLVHSDSQTEPVSWAGLHFDSQTEPGSWAGTLWQPDGARVMGWYTLTARQGQGHGLDCTLTARQSQGHGLVHSDSQTGPGSWAGTLWQPDRSRVMGWYTLTARQVQGHGLDGSFLSPQHPRR